MNYPLHPLAWLNQQEAQLRLQLNRSGFPFLKQLGDLKYQASQGNPQPQSAEATGESAHRRALQMPSFPNYHGMVMPQNFHALPLNIQQKSSFASRKPYGADRQHNIASLTQGAAKSRNNSILTKSSFIPSTSKEPKKEFELQLPKFKLKVPKFEPTKNDFKAKAASLTSSAQRKLLTYNSPRLHSQGYTSQVELQKHKTTRCNAEVELQKHKTTRCNAEVKAAETLMRLKMDHLDKQPKFSVTSCNKKVTPAKTSCVQAKGRAELSLASNSATPIATAAGLSSNRISLKTSLLYQEEIERIQINMNDALEEMGNQHRSLRLHFENAIEKLRQRIKTQAEQNEIQSFKASAKTAEIAVVKAIMEDDLGLSYPAVKNKRKTPESPVDSSLAKMSKY